MFADCVVAFPTETHGWHRTKPAGNVGAVDGHVEFQTAITVTNMIW